MSFALPFRARVTLLLLLAGAVSFILYRWPQIDLAVSATFFELERFTWRYHPIPKFLHDILQPIGIGLGFILLGLTLWHAYMRSGWRRWLFMFLGLILGPALITNTLFKDNWGRARPLTIEQFGGSKQFTPAFVISDQCVRNCSFISGDAAFGFWLHSFAYIAPQRRRRIFWAGIAVGVGYGVLRVGMGSHFLSDVMMSGIFMLLASAALYAVMFGRRALGIIWREILGDTPAKGASACP